MIGFIEKTKSFSSPVSRSITKIIVKKKKLIFIVPLQFLDFEKKISILIIRSTKEERVLLVFCNKINNKC